MNSLRNILHFILIHFDMKHIEKYFVNFSFFGNSTLTYYYYTFYL